MNELWIVQFAARIDSHNDWLDFMRFVMPQLIEHPQLLNQLLWAEAERRFNPLPSRATVGREVVRLMDALGIKFVIA